MVNSVLDFVCNAFYQLQAILQSYEKRVQDLENEVGTQKLLLHKQEVSTRELATMLLAKGPIEPKDIDHITANVAKLSEAVQAGAAAISLVKASWLKPANDH